MERIPEISYARTGFPFGASRISIATRCRRCAPKTFSSRLRGSSVACASTAFAEVPGDSRAVCEIQLEEMVVVWNNAIVSGNHALAIPFGPAGRTAISLFSCEWRGSRRHGPSATFLRPCFWSTICGKRDRTGGRVDARFLAMMTEPPVLWFTRTQIPHGASDATEVAM